MVAKQVESTLKGDSKGSVSVPGLDDPLYAPLKHRKEDEWRDIPAPITLDPLAERLPIRNQAGGMIYADLFRKSWERALKRLGLPDYNPHDLRHKWATVPLSNGAPIDEVSRWMGHSSIKITVDRYSHLTLDGSERCRQVIEATLIEATFRVHMLSGFPAPRVPGAELVLAQPGSRGNRPLPNRS